MTTNTTTSSPPTSSPSPTNAAPDEVVYSELSAAELAKLINDEYEDVVAGMNVPPSSEPRPLAKSSWLTGRSQAWRVAEETRKVVPQDQLRNCNSLYQDIREVVRTLKPQQRPNL